MYLQNSDPKLCLEKVISKCIEIPLKVMYFHFGIEEGLK